MENFQNRTAKEPTSAEERPTVTVTGAPGAGRPSATWERPAAAERPTALTPPPAPPVLGGRKGPKSSFQRSFQFSSTSLSPRRDLCRRWRRTWCVGRAFARQARPSSPSSLSSLWGRPRFSRRRRGGRRSRAAASQSAEQRRKSRTQTRRRIHCVRPT